MEDNFNWEAFRHMRTQPFASSSIRSATKLDYSELPVNEIGHSTTKCSELRMKSNRHIMNDNKVNCNIITNSQRFLLLVQLQRKKEKYNIFLVSIFKGSYST